MVSNIKNININQIVFGNGTDEILDLIVRVFGTIGWIVAGLLISWLAWDAQANANDGMLKNTFLMVAIASAVLGLFSFTLPANQ